MNLPHPTIYVTRDIERALGLSSNTPNFFIVTNKSPLAKSRDDVYTIENEHMLDTWELLAHDTMKKIMSAHPGAHIVVFKNTSQIEKICTANNWPLLNPSAALAAQVEEKISQVEWLDELETLLPPHHISVTKNIVWEKKPFILQFNRAHTGSGTYHIDTEKKLIALQEQFPNRDARITDFISGPVLTSNNVVTPSRVLVGNINYQITGLQPFTDNPFATIGNDWKLPITLLNNEQKKQYRHIVESVGNKLRASGWKGLFGVDTILDEKTGTIYLIEINARQPASTTYESILQQKADKLTSCPADQLKTTFEAHLLSLYEETLNDQELIGIEDGAQILLRVPADGVKNKERELSIAKNVAQLGCNVMIYNNDTPGSDWIRIQSEQSLMESHGVLNEFGEKIKEAISYKLVSNK